MLFGKKLAFIKCMQVLPSTGGIASCSASSKTITILVSRQIAAGAFEIHIDGVITNPMSTSASSSFQFYTFDASRVQLDSLTTNINLQATEGGMSSQSLTPGSQIVGATTTLDIKFTPVHSIPAGGVFKITFPKWNPQSTTTQLEYLQGAISCSTLGVLSSSLQCSFSNSVLTVTGGVGSTINGGIEIGFRVTGFRNPISTAQVTGFQILAQDSIGGNIDRTTATLQITTPATITNAQVTVDDSVDSSIAGIVQETNKLRLTFSSPVPLNQGCNVKVILPQQLNVQRVTSINVFGLFGTSSGLTPTVSSSDNSFSFTQCTTYSSNSLPGNIIMDSVILPDYTRTTSSFSIQIRDSSNNLVAQISSGVTFQATAGTIPSVSLAAADNTILATTSLTFTIKPQHTLDVTARLVIQLPSAFVLGSSCSFTNVLNTNPSASCAISGRQMTIDNFLSSTYDKSSGNSLQFSINPIKLPQSTSTQSGYSFVTYMKDSTDSQFYTVDTFSGSIPLTLSVGSLTATVTPDSFIAFAVSTYTFAITPDHYIPRNGYMKITYPSEISISDASFSQSQCGNFVNFPTTPTCVIDTTNRVITINNGFRTTNVPNGGIQFSFTIPGIQNPIDLKASSTFTVKTYSAEGEVMDQKVSGITIQMTSTAVMRSLTVTPDSYVNSALTKYTFQITATSPVTENNYVVIKFPPEIKLPSTEGMLGCSSDDSAIFNSITCTFNTAMQANSIKASLDLRTSVSQINVLQTFRISVSNIMNPNSTKPTSAFSVQITDKQFGVINSSPTNVVIQTNTAYTLKRSSIVSNVTGAAQPAKYNITIYPEHEVQVGGGLFIQYPSQVSIPGTLTVSVSSIYSKSSPTISIDRSSRQIQIKDAFQLKVAVPSGSTAFSPITIVLDGFKNPLQNNPTSSFIVRTMDISGTQNFFIDQVNDGLVLNSNCDYPCATCSSTSGSNCTSCYSTSTFNKLQGTTCVSDCASGKFFNSRTGKCEDCISPCLTCSNSSTNCTSCGLNDFIYLFNNTCRNDCPNGYVADPLNNKCQRCSADCLTCSITSTSCTSCNRTSRLPFLYQSSCLNQCPVNVSIPGTGVCNNCDSMCKTCAGTTSSCTSCLSHMKFDSVLKTCTAVCNEGTQIYNQTQGKCLYCDSNCGTCAGDTQTCTSCSSGLTLNTDNTCKSSCGKDDQINLNGVCKQCELPCAQCRENVKRCTKCQGDYLLYNTTCVQYCPEKYEVNNSTRQCVLVGLICPDGFTINEAGDGCIPNEIECPEGYIINRQKTACVPAPGSPVPFPFIFFSAMLCLLVVGSYIKDKFFTKIYTNLIALLGLQEMLIYLLMLGYSGANGSWGPFVLSLIAILCLMTANIGLYIMYKKDILKDESFAKWCRLFPKTTKYIPMIVLCVNFKAVKLYYSGFYGLESCLAQFDDPVKNLFRPLRMITYFSFIFVYIPVIIADILIFATEDWGQLLILGIESFLLTLAIFILTIIEFRHPDKLIPRSDEQYTRIKPKSFANDTMVMSAMVDVDESTMIRGKVVDDDYEIFLRKKAFVSVINQVKKNYEVSNKLGLNLGGNIDQITSKFDTKNLKLRRAFSLEEIKEEEWQIASDEERDYQTKKPDDDELDLQEYMRERRYSYPLTPRTRAQVADPQFKKTIKEIKEAVVETYDNEDNVYAECKAPDKNKEQNRKKTISRRTQTYLRELLQLDGGDLQESDLEIIMEDEAEIEADYAQNLIDNIIEGLSESESNLGGKKRSKKKRKVANKKGNQEIPDFELADIMGEFEIDDLGNFIILRGEKGELLDKKERRVNRRGYLVDRFGNIINKQGQVIFKAVELDSDDEIPAPYGFEKRKKNLLNLGQDGEFKVEGEEKPIDDDEDLIDKELKQMKKSMKRIKRKQLPDGQIVEEEVDEDDAESSIDSLMAESPGKYQIDQYGANEDEILANITKKKVPVKRTQLKSNLANRRPSPKKTGELSPQESSKKQNGPLQNVPPKRIKREDTREMFPSLAIEGSEQKKLFKIAEQIGEMATQIAEQQKKNNQSSIMSQDNSNLQNQEKLKELKEEHFKDIMKEARPQKQDPKQTLPPRPPVDKIYGNLGDVVNYEEQLLKDQLKGNRAQSPFSSRMTSRIGYRGENTSTIGDKRRLRGLESIYLQKFDKKAGMPGKKPKKAQFRNTLQQFVDDPEFLLDDGVDRQKQNEMSLMVAEKLDKLQKQYMSNTETGRFADFPQSSSSQAIIPTVGASLGKRAGSISRSIFNQDPSLEPIKKGNWVPRDNL